MLELRSFTRVRLCALFHLSKLNKITAYGLWNKFHFVLYFLEYSWPKMEKAIALQIRP